MNRPTLRTVTVGLALTLALGGCATASSPWAQHAEQSAAKAASLDPAAVCPVVLQNSTDAAVDASYEVVGMTFDLGLLPAGQVAEFKVQCQAQRVRATAVSHSVSLDEPQLRYQKMARLDLAEVTRLHLTQADRVR